MQEPALTLIASAIHACRSYNTRDSWTVCYV